LERGRKAIPVPVIVAALDARSGVAALEIQPNVAAVAFAPARAFYSLTEE